MIERNILDFRAGVPWSEHALDVLGRATASAWADPTHPSSEGRRAATWLDAARSTIASLTGFPYVVLLTDRDAAWRAWADAVAPRRVVAAATHRRSVLRAADLVVPVDEHGTPRWADTDIAHEDAVLVQAANEETGVIDALPTSGRVLLDASAVLGRSPIRQPVDAVVADLRAASSPVDVAVLLSRRPLGLRDEVQVPAAVVAADALTAAMEGLQVRTARECEAMERFEGRLRLLLPDVAFHGRDRVGHVRSLSVLHLDGETLMRALDAEGYVVGSGSACVHDGTPSHVLAAMGAITHGNLRLALPPGLDLTVLDRFADTLAATAKRLREEAGVADL